ncbi:MAG: hypothetical protein AAGA29_07825 [Planctomycetota bacterium]
MARTPKPSIFQGISAISDAGGIEGFVREVLAEAKRHVMLVCTDPKALRSRKMIRGALEAGVEEVVSIRLQPDLERVFLKRISDAILACESCDGVFAAFESSFMEASVWWQEVIRDAAFAVLPRLDEIVTQIQEDAGLGKEKQA